VGMCGYKVWWGKGTDTQTQTDTDKHRHTHTHIHTHTNEARYAPARDVGELARGERVRHQAHQGREGCP